MKILVVGAAGYLGTKLSKLLLMRGQQITCIDNLYYNQGPYVAETFINKIGRAHV